jgi:hypothetical protein
MGEGTAGEWDPADRSSGLERSHLVTIPRSQRSAIKRLRLPSLR